jgi:hypothetical protein
MVKVRGDRKTMDILQDWKPPAVAVGFRPEEVRAVSIAARFCKAMALALKECGRTREEVARTMSAYLGEEVSKNMLDAYVSEARDSHVINVARFAALVYATGDMRLLALLPEMFGFIVAEKKYRHWINAAVARDKASEMLQFADQEMRVAKLGDWP